MMRRAGLAKDPWSVCAGCLVPRMKCLGIGHVKDGQVVVRECPGVTGVLLLLRPGLVKVRRNGDMDMGDYTTAIWVTIGLTVALTVPVVWQFLQPNDDDFGDLTRRK